ncbi:hypothetical protein [Halosegnis marinus]|uniref:Uncharacterized protein n=1 Tax=Halosegnis marinus TaxID=3034023 RepID=A0ABD5ZN26_9EURY|nr:hypothetical protein [Halosegnis sp. DT85]
MDAVRRLLENALDVTDEQRVRADIEAALELLAASEAGRTEAATADEAGAAADGGREARERTGESD